MRLYKNIKSVLSVCRFFRFLVDHGEQVVIGAVPTLVRRGSLADIGREAVPELSGTKHEGAPGLLSVNSRLEQTGCLGQTRVVPMDVVGRLEESGNCLRRRAILFNQP